MTARTYKPILPRRRPLWIVVLAGMLVFGFYQELAKVQLNHYVHVLQENPGVAEMSAELREKWYDVNPQPKRIHYYVMERTWNGFHRFAPIGARKWALTSTSSWFLRWTPCFCGRPGTSNGGPGYCVCHRRNHHGGVFGFSAEGGLA